ncbi:hypothetical protein BH20VER3_BH20VER3_02190 [soil metagenome]
MVARTTGVTNSVSAYLSKSDFKVARTCAAKLYYKKLGYPSIRDDDEYLQFLADGGYMVEAIARLCHPDGIEIGFDKGAEASAEETRRVLEVHETITLFEATLLFGQKLARVDILRKQGSTFELIEVKAKSIDTRASEKPFRGARGGISSEWQPYLEDVTFQYSVLRRLFPEAKIVPYLCLADKAKTTSIHSLFSKFQLSASNLFEARFRRPKVFYTGDPDELRRSHFLAQLNVTAEVHDLLPEVESSSAVFVASLQNTVTKIPVAINVGCRTCEYRLPGDEATSGDQKTQNGFAECWGELANEHPHILDYYYLSSIGGRNGPVVNDLISRKQARLSDIGESDLVRADGTPGPINIRQRIQREYTLAGREYLDPALVRRLKDLPYPLHFIDFETSRVAVPYHAGMRPYEQVAFQWSCHTIRDSGAPLEHAEWINVTDAFPNFQFAESLMNQLGDRGSFLTWSHHENSVLNDIRRQMQRYGYSNPQIEHWLDIVPKRNDNASTLMVDMCEMAKVGYFHPKMKGRLSLKYVLPAIWESNDALHGLPEFKKYYRRDENGRPVNPYDTLPPLPFGNPEEETETEKVVIEGTGAMRAYQEMLYGVSRNDEGTTEQWRRLLLQYCELDTAAMIIVWTHWTK